MPFTNVHLLRIFLHAVQERSFSGAADLLQMSQPSVSIQIRRLEKTLGVKLFQRTGKAVHLTSEGELAAEYAHRISDLLQDFEAKFAKLKGAATGRLLVGGNTAPGLKYYRLLSQSLRKSILTPRFC